MPARLSNFFGLLLLLLSATGAAIAQAQEPYSPDGIPEALRQEQTSSPRQTLTRFLANSRMVVEGFHETGYWSEETRWAGRRAANALDFSTTPHSGTWGARASRALLLREILDRIPLPPSAEIPGDSEVADGTIDSWTIPGTRIEIARVNEGPREGEFLFASGTVERLESFYRMVKHLPRKPGTPIGFYDTYMTMEQAAPTRERMLRNRLKGVDMSSPRSTFDGFLDSVNRAFRIVSDTRDALKAEPPTMTRQEAVEAEIEAGNLLRRAVATLDLRQVPEAHRADVGLETVLQMKEIFDRMALPPLDAIPNHDMVKAARRGEGPWRVRPGEPVRWKYPNTEFEIIERLEGDNQGSFYFSDETVSLVRDAYKAVRHLPYREDLPGTLVLEYLSPERSEGFYDHYISTPGDLIPGTSALGSLVDRLPDWSHSIYAEQTLWQWIGLGLAIIAIVLVGTAIFVIVLRLARRSDEPYDEWIRILAPVTLALFVAKVTRFLDETINITGDVLSVVSVVAGLIVIAMWVIAAFWACRAFAETVILSPRIPEEGINASLWRISARIVGFFIGVFIVVEGIQDMGLDPIPLVAGLGVGGLAVALAAQKTIANFIGSLILFANKPVRVGDFCAYGDGKVGTVEEINLLSTRIRTLERSVVTIPNADFSEMQLDNYSMRYERRFKTVLQLRYETTPDQLRYVLAELRKLLYSHPMVNPDPARVRFVAYGAYSLDVEVYTYIRTNDHNVFLAIREDILLRIADIVHEAGTGFAFPSQTAYLGRDDGLDEERMRRAEERVREWRSTGELPFPEFTDEQQREMADALDYPPDGAVTSGTDASKDQAGP